MNKALIKNIVIVILGIVTVFSTFKYVVSLKEKYELLNTLERLNAQAVVLEMEKQNLLETLEKEKQLLQELSQENVDLKEHLRASKKRLTKLFADYQAAERLNTQASLLKAENIALREENENLRTKLSSISELKKAIKELKRQVRKVGVEIKKAADTLESMEGNRGFLIKDGKSTYLAKVKIEVIPVSIK